MATVRFSESLKSEIIGNARNMFAVSVEDATNNFPAEWHTRIYDTMFSAEDRAKFDALPDWVMERKEKIDFAGFMNCPDDVWQTSVTRLKTWALNDSVNLEFVTPKPWPYNDSVAPVGGRCTWRTFQAEYNDPRWDWLKPQMKEYTKQLFNALDKREQFVGGVTKLMQTYSTLAPALKAWPALWDLVPEEAKERHKTVSARSRKDTTDLGVDLNSMTAAVARTKLTGGL
jgi:hypothetical protein